MIIWINAKRTGPEMARIFAAAVMLGSLLCAQEPVFKSNVREVSVVFRVVDAANRPVSGITSQEIQVSDDGVPRTITSFHGDVAHAQVVILVDVSGSMSAVFEPLQGALDTFADIVSQDYDRQPGDVLLSLIAFSNTANVLVDRTSNTSEFKMASRRLRPSGTTSLVDSVLATLEHAFDSREVARRRPGVSGGPADGGPLGGPQPVNGVDRGTRSKFLVIFTDAGENSSAHRWSDIGSAILGKEITIYSIAFESGSPDSDVSMLSKITTQSGGKLFRSKASDLQRVYAEIARDIRSHYQLTFSAADIVNPRIWRSLQVTVNRPRVTVFARAGYCPEAPCQKRDGTFIGRPPRSWNEVLTLSRDPAVVSSVRQHLKELKFDYTRESENIIRELAANPILVERVWDADRRRPGPSLVTRTGTRSVSIDAEVCGITADPNPAAHSVSDPSSGALSVTDPEIRLARRPGSAQLSAEAEESYFQTQAIFYLEDGSSRIPGRIRVQCNRPNFLISEDLVQFASQAVAVGLKARPSGRPQ